MLFWTRFKKTVLVFDWIKIKYLWIVFRISSMHCNFLQIQLYTFKGNKLKLHSKMWDNDEIGPRLTVETMFCRVGIGMFGLTESGVAGMHVWMLDAMMWLLCPPLFVAAKIPFSRFAPLLPLSLSPLLLWCNGVIGTARLLLFDTDARSGYWAIRSEAAGMPARFIILSILYSLMLFNVGSCFSPKPEVER